MVPTVRGHWNLLTFNLPVARAELCEQGLSLRCNELDIDLAGGQAYMKKLKTAGLSSTLLEEIWVLEV